MISDSTREWLMRRANQSAIPLARLGLTLANNTPVTAQEVLGIEVYTIKVLIDGNEDESFNCTGPYEVNIADWIAEQLTEVKDKYGIIVWSVIILRFDPEDAGEIVYHITDEGVRELT